MFPHRYDYIYADYPDTGEKPKWKTESRYPLSDRLLQQGNSLFGVRFGKQTRYCLLDIDITSAYHPRRDAFAISNLVASLEPLGLVSYIACTSSYSNGIHLYFPFQQIQNSWEVAAAVLASLEKAGFKLAPGQLEIFPNPRPYIPGNRPSLFQAHRLPLQRGSYLLDQDFQPIWSDRSVFVQQWAFAQNRNELDSKQLKRFAQIQQKVRPVSGKAEKFLADLNAELETGWTGLGQTNYLLGRIALRTYVFHHILFGGEPLTGPALVDEMIAVARSLPGYDEWCQHQHEIAERASEWARCVEGSHYFPYGSRHSVTETTENIRSISSKSTITWNQQQSESARERIRQAIVLLLETNTLPAATTARFRALTQFGIGGSSLYRHRDLWHPDHLVENPPDPPTLNLESSDCAGGASDDLNSTSLFPVTGGNLSSHKVSSRSIESTSTSGCNDPLVSSSLSYDQRMRQFLASGDPILVAEALMYFNPQESNPRVVQAPQTIDLPLDPNLDCGSFQSLDAGYAWMRSQMSRSHEVPAILLETSGDLEDLSDLLATITIHVRRLGWTQEQARLHLLRQFGKFHQSRLSHEELVRWLQWLEANGFPANTG